MEKKAIPPMLAVIREAECIGCTKCIQACPVDAIIGAAKQMHTVIADICTGCELCIKPCPVDCIEMLPLSDYNEEQQQYKTIQAKQHYHAHLLRNNETTIIKQTQQQLSLIQRKAEIKAAIKRVKLKKQLTMVQPQA